MFKTPAVTGDLSVAPFNAVSVSFMDFEALFLGGVTFRIAISWFDSYFSMMAL